MRDLLAEKIGKLANEVNVEDVLWKVLVFGSEDLKQ
jgi:hypothetical protein